jgi:hypothetical protein
MSKTVNEMKMVRRTQRKARVSGSVRGTAERPRLSVFRSVKHIYAQIVDDTTGKTLGKQGGGDGDREAAGGQSDCQGHHAGGIRPQRVQISRARQGTGGRGTRRRIEVLTERH